MRYHNPFLPAAEMSQFPNFQQPPALPLRLKYLHSPSLGDQTKSLSALRLLFLHLHSSIYLLTCNRTPAPLLLMPGPNRQCVSRQCVVTMRRQGGRGLSRIRNLSLQCVVSVIAKSHTQAAGALQKWMQLWLWPTVLFHLPSVCFKVAAWHDAPHCLPWCYGRLGSKVFVTRTYENTELSVSAYQRLIEWLDLKNLWYHHISSKALLYRSMANLVAMIAPH